MPRSPTFGTEPARESDRLDQAGASWLEETGEERARKRRSRSRRRPRRRRRSHVSAAAAVVLVLVAAAVSIAAFVDRSASRHAGNRPVATANPAPSVPEAPVPRVFHRHRPRLLPASAVYPFAPSRTLRVPDRRDALPRFWDDGRACSVGCRPVGAIGGWPLKPFHRQHALRAGLNELRANSLHEGLDIEARGGARVYAIQPGYAHIIQPLGGEARVQVGDYIYWHIHLRVREGELVEPYRTVLGYTLRSYGHLHLSEVQGGVNLNPLRPGGRVLAPWRDTDPPVIGAPAIASDGRVYVKAYDPQSFRVRGRYQTPVLAPAALAYQVFDPHNRRVAGLHWSLRGTHNLPFSLSPLIYAPGAKDPGFWCYATRVICKPDWDYVLAGGLVPRLTELGLPAGRYRLAMYAWDWAGNVSARDAFFQVTASGVRTVRAPVTSRHLLRQVRIPASGARPRPVPPTRPDAAATGGVTSSRGPRGDRPQAREVGPRQSRAPSKRIGRSALPRRARPGTGLRAVGPRRERGRPRR